MKLIGVVHPLQAFNRLTSFGKSIVISAICALTGIGTGICTYLIAAKMLGSHEGLSQLGALLAAIVAAMLASALIEWLREIIGKGEVELKLPPWRVIPQLLIALFLFEVAVTVIHEAVKETFGEFDVMRGLAADIAGQRSKGLGPIIDKETLSFAAPDRRARLDPNKAPDKDKLEKIKAFEAFESALLKSVAPDDLWNWNSFYYPATAYGKIAQLMTPAEQMLAVAVPQARTKTADGSSLSDEQIEVFGKNLLDDPEFKPNPPKPVEPNRSPSTPFGTDEPPGGFRVPIDRFLPPWAIACADPAIEAGDRGKIAACRAALMAVDRTVAQQLLLGGVNRILLYSMIYNPVSFAAAHLEPGLKAEVEELVCDNITIRNLEAKLDRHLYDQLCEHGHGQSPLATLSDVGEQEQAIAKLNHRLLAAAGIPIFKPLQTNWRDFWLLVACWAGAAVLLSAALVYAIFGPAELQVETSDGHQDRFFLGLGIAVAAGALPAALMLLAQLPWFLSTLAFDPCHWRGSWSWLTVLPNAASELSLCSVPRWGGAVPGWLSAAALVAAFIAARAWALRRLPATAPGWLRPASWLLLPLLCIGAVPPNEEIADGIAALFVTVAGTWLVPSVGLALLLPYLKPVSTMPRHWGAAAIMVSILLAAWTLIRLAYLSPIELVALAVGALVFFGLGLQILAQNPISDLWPMLAMTICMTGIGAGATLRSMSFETALGRMVFLSDNVRLPPDLEYYTERERRLREAYLRGELWPEFGLAAEETPTKERKATHRGVSLELALVGGLSFWLTLAILAAWRLREETAGAEVASHAVPETEERLGPSGGREPTTS